MKKNPKQELCEMLRNATVRVNAGTACTATIRFATHQETAEFAKLLSQIATGNGGTK